MDLFVFCARCKHEILSKDAYDYLPVFDGAGKLVDGYLCEECFFEEFGFLAEGAKMSNRLLQGETEGVTK